MGDPIKNIYDKYGLSTVGTYDQFKEALADPTARQKIYNKHLSSVGTYDQFNEVVESTINFKQTPIQSSFQDPNRLSKDRGYRNNNPLNLKDKRTGQFRVFDTLEEGYQASEKDLTSKLSGRSPAVNSYLKKQGKTWGEATLKDVIYTWAPPSDNSSSSLNKYLKLVQDELGVDPNTTHPSQVDVKELTIAMSKMESPHSYNTMLQANRANKNTGTPSPANKLSPITADLEKEATELANKKVEETYSKLTNLEKGDRTIKRKGIFGIVTDMFDGNGYGASTATKQEIEAAKIEVLKKGKYGSFNTPEELATVVNPNYKKKMDDANRAAEKQKASLEADFNTDGLIEQGDIVGGFGYKKNDKGEKVVNVNPNRLFDFNLSNENYVKVDDVLKLKEHPAISKDPKKFNYREQKELNQYLRDIQSDLTKDQKIARQANTGIYNDYLTYAGGRADILKSELEKQYGKLNSKKMSQETAAKLQRDPRFAEYKQVSDNYLKAYETLKTKSNDYKLAELDDNLAKEFNKKQDTKYKNFTKLGTIEKSIQRTAEFVKDAGKALASSPGDLATLIGTGVDAVADTDLGTTDAISKAYNADKISTTSDSRGVLVRATKLKDKDIYAIYDDDGKITEFTDGGYYTVSDDPNSKVFKELLEEEKSSENSGKPSIKINQDGLLHGIREPMIDMVPLILGGGVARIGLQSTAALLPKVSRLGNSLNKLSESSKFLSFAGSFAGFSGKMTDSAIKEGGLVNPGDIFIASTAKTALEAVIEMYNPIEGRIFTDKLFSSLSKQEVKQLSKIITEQGVFKALPIIGRNFGKTLLNNGLSEGFEEIIAAVAEPEFVNRVLNATIDTQYDETASVKDVAESFLVGALSGVAMGGILEGGPSAIYQLRNPDQVFKESIRAGLQNKDLFDKITNQNREEELKDVEDEAQIETINKKYDKINSVIGKAHEYSSKVFQEHPDSGHVPASHMQTLYATTAFSKAINESKQYTLEPDIEANNERIAIADKKLKQLDVFIANSLDVFASIEDINSIDNIMSKKELSDNYGELYNELKSIASTESKSKHSDQQVLDNVTAKIKSKLVELKNKSDNKVDPELQKKIEAEKAAVAAGAKTEKQTQKAKEAEAAAIAKKKAGQPLSKDESKLVDPIFKLKLKNLEEELKVATLEELEEIKSNPEYQFPEAANMISAFEKGETFKIENIDETDYLNIMLDSNDPTTLDKKYKNNQEQLALDNIKVQKFLADTIKGNPKRYGALSNLLPALESNAMTDMFALDNALSVVGVDINDVIHDRVEVKETGKKGVEKEPVKKGDPVVPTPKNRNKTEGVPTEPIEPNLMVNIPGSISKTIRLQGYDENNNPVGSPIIVSKEDFFANRFTNYFTSQIPNARYVKVLDSIPADIDKNAALAVKAGDTVYYEYIDTEFNNSSKRTDDNFEIQVVAYTIVDDNGYITIVSKDTPNAERSVVANIPAINTNQTPEQQKHLKDLRARFLKDKSFLPVKIKNTSTITDYRYGLFSEEQSTHREVTEEDMLNPKATVGILSTPWNAADGDKATVFINGEAVQLPYPAPIAQVGSVVLLIDNQIHILHTKKIKDIPNKYNELSKLLREFASEKNKDVRNGIWSKLVGIQGSEGIVRYRTEKSNVDVETRGEVVNTKGIGPQLYYNPDSDTIVYEGKRYAVTEENLNEIINDLAERRVNIDAADLNDKKYLSNITKYLTTDLADLNNKTGAYQVAPTIYTEIGTVEVQQSTDINAKKADIERRRQEDLETTKNIGEDKLKEGRENTKKIVESLKQRYHTTSVQGIIIRILEKLIDFNKYSTIVDSDYINGRNASGQATWFGMILSQETLDGILEGKEFEVHTFIHELIHGFTTSKISDYNIEKQGLIPGFKSNLTAKEKNAIEQLQRIFEKVKRDNPKSKEYGFTNLDEFIAEAFSNSSFQYTLKNTKAEGKKSNLFSEFINAIGDLLFEQLERWAKRFNKEIPQRDTITGILEDVLAWTEDLIDQNNKLAYIATNEEINAKYDAELKALEQPNSELEAKKADIEKRKQALRDLMKATGDDIFMLGVEDGTFMGEALLNMNENGDVILTRYADSEEGLTKGKGKTKNLKDIAGQFGGEQIATSGIEGGAASFVNGVVGEYHIPLQELIDLIKSEDVVFAGLGNKEFVLSPHIADKYLTKINGKQINAKYDAELAALEQTKTTPKKLSKKEEQAALFDFFETEAKETTATDIQSGPGGEEIILKVSSKKLDSDAKGLDWFKQRLGEISISIDDDIINSLYDIFKVGGSNIYGVFMKASVVLSSNSNEKVTRHEAMHVVFNLFLNPKQQEQILNELYDKFGKEMGITKVEFETELKEWRTKKDNTANLKTDSEQFYSELPVLIRLQEKLSDLFEDYKDQLSLFTEVNRTKYPGITKFFDKLYKFMQSNYLIARSYFTESVTIQQLFDQLEYDTLGRDFLGRRKKSVKELLGRNIESVTGTNPFFKLGWSSALTNRFARFINKELLDTYLYDKYGEELGRQPTLYDVQEVLGKDIGVVLKDFTKNLDNVVSLWKDLRTLSRVAFSGKILDEIIEQFKTNKDFQKIVYSNLNSIRGLKVEEIYDQSDRDDNPELREDEIIEGWILKEISVDPIQKISRKLKEFISSIPVMNGTRVSNFSDTGQGEYYDTSKIHSKLLEKLSNSTDLSDMLVTLNQMKDEYDWVKLLYMNVLGKDEYYKRRTAGNLNIYFDDIIANELVDTKTNQVITGETIKNADVIFDIWLSIGALRNIDHRFIKESTHEGTKKVALVASNKVDINFELEKKITNFFSNNYYNNKGKLIKFEPQWLADIITSMSNPDIPQIIKVLNKLGVSLDRETIVNILKNDKAKFINSLNLMYKNLSDGKALNQKSNDSIYKYSYKNAAGKQSSTNGHPVRILTQIITKNDFNLEKRSILTLKGELKYNHTINNYITKTYDKFLKNPKKWVEDRKFLNSSDGAITPVLLHRDLEFYDDLIEAKDELDLIYYEGNKRVNNFVGTEFGDMSFSDIAASNFNIFASSENKDYNYFNMYAFSDASNKAAMRLKKLATNIDSDKVTVQNKLANIALAEAKRIQYINSLETPSIYKDYDKNGKSFQLLTFLNNSPIFTELLKGDTKILSTMIVTDSKGKSKFNKKIQEQLELEIDEHLSKEINKYLRKAIDNGQLEVKDNKITRTYDSKYSSKVNNQNLKDYFYNQYYYTAATNLMFNGDPAFYGNKIDKATGLPVGVYIELSKRAKQGDSPATLGVFKRPNFRAIIIKDMFMKSKPNIISAIEKLYNPKMGAKIAAKFTRDSSNNLTDAGTYITLDRKEEQMKAYNLWVEDIHAPLFNRLRTNTTIPEDFKHIFDVVKPFYYGVVKQDSNGAVHAVPVQVKNAEVVLIPQLAYIKKDTLGELIMPDMSLEEITDFSEYRSPELAKLLYLMQKNKIDSAMFESAVKAGRFNHIDFADLSNSTIELNGFDLPNEHWGEQQKNPIKQEDYKILLGSQVRKLIYGDLDPDFIFKHDGEEYSNNAFRNLFDETIVRDLQEELEKTRKTFDNEKKVYDTLERKTLETNPTGQAIEAFEIQSDGKPLQPLETNGAILEKFLNSFFKKASKVKGTGAVLANTPNLGYSDKLEIVTNEDGSIKYVEVAVPIHTEAFRLLANKDGLVDINDPRIPEKMRQGFFYRIPTEDKYSMYPIKIKYLIPMGSVIMLPNEATEISGLDFDVDKMYGFFYKTKVKFTQDTIRTHADNFAKAGYKFSDDQIEGLLNELLNTTEDIDTIADLLKVANEGFKKIAEGDGVQMFDRIDVIPSSMDTSDSRANLRLDMMLAVAKTKGFAKSFFDGGSKEKLEELVKLYKQKDYGFEKSIANPNLQEEITARNLVAKNLIGIFANSNAFHNLIQGRHSLELRQPLKLEMKDGSKFELKDFSKVLNEVGERISKELSILLFASTEDAKNPVLEPLNINQLTAGIATTLIRLGLPLDYTIEYINNESFKRVITYAQANNKKDLVDMLKKPSPELLKELGITKEEARDYYNIAKISQDLLSVERAVKVDTANVGPTFSEVLVSLNKAKQVIRNSINPKQDFKIDGIESVLPDIRSYYDDTNKLIYTIERPSNIAQINGFMEILVEEVNMLSRYFNYFSENFEAIREEVLKSTKNYFLRADQVQLINLEIYNYHIQKAIQSLNDSEIRDIYSLYQNFPDDFINDELLNEPQYQFLKSIFSINYEGIPRLEADVTAYSKEDVNNLKDSFEQYINESSDTKNGLKLGIYAIINGLKYGKGSFASLVPPSFYRSTVGGMIRTIINGGSLDQSVPNKDIAELIIYNNYTKLVPELQATDLKAIATGKYKLANDADLPFFFVKIANQSILYKQFKSEEYPLYYSPIKIGLSNGKIKDYIQDNTAADTFKDAVKALKDKMEAEQAIENMVPIDEDVIDMLEQMYAQQNQFDGGYIPEEPPGQFDEEINKRFNEITEKADQSRIDDKIAEIKNYSLEELDAAWLRVPDNRKDFYKQYFNARRKEIQGSEITPTDIPPIVKETNKSAVDDFFDKQDEEKLLEQRQRKVNEINSITSIDKLNEMESKVPENVLEFYKPHFDRRREELKTPNIPNQKVPEVFADRVITVNGREIVVKISGGMYYTNNGLGVPATDNITRNLARVKLDIIDNVLRTSNHEGKNYYILSDGKVISADTETLGSETVKDKFKKDIIIAKSAKYKKDCNGV